jgi:hypothetical protein
MSYKITDAFAAYAAWWQQITTDGDPIRNPNLLSDAFKAGWDAAENEARKERLEMAAEHYRELRDAVAEARFSERTGEDYGSF